MADLAYPIDLGAGMDAAPLSGGKRRRSSAGSPLDGDAVGLRVGTVHADMRAASGLNVSAKASEAMQRFLLAQLRAIVSKAVAVRPKGKLLASGHLREALACGPLSDAVVFGAGPVLHNAVDEPVRQKRRGCRHGK